MPSLLLGALVSLGAAASPLFTDVTQSAGLGSVQLVSGDPGKDYILGTLGPGAAALDFDNDGWLDLYVGNGLPLAVKAPSAPAEAGPAARLFRNRGDGTFADVTSGSGLGDSFWAFGAAAGDYDNDGWVDLFVSSWGRDRLYHNRGDGTFEEVGGPAGVDDPRWGASAAFADFNQDGLLDLFVATYLDFDPAVIPKRGDPKRPCLYRGAAVMCGPRGLPGEVDILFLNRGDGTFADATAGSGLRTDLGMYGLGVAVADYDEDGDPDVYVANDSTPNELYRNRGDGRFEEVGGLSGVAYGVDGIEVGSMGTSFGDYDNDGHLDLVVTNFSHQFYQLFRWAGEGFFEDVSFAAGVAEPTYLSLGWATDFFDYDNDGWQDLFFANGHVYPEVDRMQSGTTYAQANQLFHNVPNAAASGGRAFEPVGEQAGPGFATPGHYRAGGPFDFDRDGDLDLFLTVSDGRPLLLRNEAGGRGGWIAFRLRGRASNRSGLGARLILTSGGMTQVRSLGSGGSYLWSADRPAHFGIGESGSVDSLEVIWPGGARQRYRRLKPRTEYLLVEGDSAARELPAAPGARPGR